MVKVYDQLETDFTHNGTVIKPYSCEVEEKTNGMFNLGLEASLEYVDLLKELNILKVQTPRGEQLFRITKATKTLNEILVDAEHIFYDLCGNFLLDVRPVETSAMGALNYILENAKVEHRFRGYSNLQVYNTAYYIRKNPVEAIMGSDNCILDKWGGLLERDNFDINILADGKDNGYIIEYGKNLIGIEDELDTSEVVTSLLPTWVDEGNKVYYLPEKYIDSPLEDKYPIPRVKEYRVTLEEEEKELPIKEIEALVRDRAEKQFSENKIDEPIISMKVDFVELSKTEAYKKLNFLQTLNLNDYVTVKVPKLGIDVKSQVVQYKYDALGERYKSLVIGNFKRDLSSMNFTFNQLNNKIDEATDFLTGAMQYAQDVITGNKGGHVITRKDADNKPYEILIMDNSNIAEAKNVIRMNKEGIGFSSNGYNGPFSTAITIKGGIVADFINTGVLTADLIKAGTLQDKKGTVILNLDKGTFEMKGRPDGSSSSFTLNNYGYNIYSFSGKRIFGIDDQGKMFLKGDIETQFNQKKAIEISGPEITFYSPSNDGEKVTELNSYGDGGSWSHFGNRYLAITSTIQGGEYNQGKIGPYMVFDMNNKHSSADMYGDYPIRFFKKVTALDGMTTPRLKCPIIEGGLWIQNGKQYSIANIEQRLKYLENRV
ncbi:phage tail spike protein [Miniphocaeibacter massiliensis]|uniref:phage tail spike protein n=1 Tax=Miniphocaeibacter massiliensis TaxID=2041841 RepID=UPI000C1C1736|nr:phage tail spike protein [Miniphocaeibacter massiliensis]